MSTFPLKNNIELAKYFISEQMSCLEVDFIYTKSHDQYNTFFFLLSKHFYCLILTWFHKIYSKHCNEVMQKYRLKINVEEQPISGSNQIKSLRLEAKGIGDLFGLFHTCSCYCCTVAIHKPLWNNHLGKSSHWKLCSL